MSNIDVASGSRESRIVPTQYLTDPASPSRIERYQLQCSDLPPPKTHFTAKFNITILFDSFERVCPSKFSAAFTFCFMTLVAALRDRKQYMSLSHL